MYKENDWSDPLFTSSPEETETVGKGVAEALLSNPALPRVIAFRGDLGVGKTAFTRGFTSVIAPEARVKSPTFALVNQYKSRDTGLSVFHFDMYRIQDGDDLYSIGFHEYLDGKNFVLIEWSENIDETADLPQDVIFVEISKCQEGSPDRRCIRIYKRNGLDANI